MAAIVPAVAAQIDELGSSAREGLDETLTAILLFFFLKDGNRIWNWLVQLRPHTTTQRPRRDRPTRREAE